MILDLCVKKGMDAFIGDRGIKSYAGVLKKDNKLFYNEL